MVTMANSIRKVVISTMKPSKLVIYRLGDDPPDQSQSIEHDVQFLEHFFRPLPPDRTKPKVSDETVIPVFRKIREFSMGPICTRQGGEKKDTPIAKPKSYFLPGNRTPPSRDQF